MLGVGLVFGGLGRGCAEAAFEAGGEVERDVDEAAVLSQVHPREADGEGGPAVAHVGLEGRALAVPSGLDLMVFQVRPALSLWQFDPSKGHISYILENQ